MSYETPKVVEIPKKLEPLDRDTFIDGLGKIALTGVEEDKIEKVKKEVDI